ncbi:MULTISPECIES: SOUL family heme-binding protein [Mycolicibacterium]|uniref:SOUL family heme-binding protein n=1 Tax=Mycolicibacterium monacense TaxID=85693 RepID=UPI0007EBDF45|nr:heme-binding protein [Mycolicibacterium monacense]OBB72016.1 heme-binding protein [Mycolicibacterium monacense]
MLDSVLRIAGQVAEGAGAVVGIRHGTEEPPHTTQPVSASVAIRRYDQRIAAETTVSADEEASRNEGFRRLARYIFGGNHGGTEIAMTAPVTQQRGTKIAMTAPVAQSSQTAGEWTIRFFMPSKWTMDTLPTPNDDRVRLTVVPAETVAVLTFTGDRGPRAVAERTEELQNTLRDSAFEPIGEPAAWFYDPPWTLPFRRRNEIAVAVRQRSGG